MSQNRVNSEDQFRIKLLKKLNSTLKKFDRYELKTIVVPYFASVSWNDIKDGLVNKKMALNVTNIVKTIDDLIKQKGINNNIIQDLLLKLELIESSRHSSKRFWYTYEMKNQTNKNDTMKYSDPNDLNKAIFECLQKYNCKANVNTIFFDDAYFVIVVENRGPKKNFAIPVPVIFAVKLDLKYFFCIKKNVSLHLRNILTESLGYALNKPIKLYGKHLPTLYALLLNKKNGMIPEGYIDIPEKSKPIVKNSGIDFTQHDHRNNYVKKRMGIENLKLESFIFQQIDVPIESKENIDLSDIKINVRWEFRSKNVFEMIPFMSKNCQLAHPTPSYITECMMLGKNEIKYK